MNTSPERICLADIARRLGISEKSTRTLAVQHKAFGLPIRYTDNGNKMYLVAEVEKFIFSRIQAARREENDPKRKLAEANAFVRTLLPTRTTRT